MESILQKSFSVKRLRKLFAQKVFAIPELQREFVWNAKKACALLDSIYRNLPIGIAMIWRTGRVNSNQLRRQLHILPPYDGQQNRQIWYLIDGQQRLSVFYQVFEGQKITNASGREVDFARIYVTLAHDADMRFEYLKRHDLDVHFKVTEILSPNWRQYFHGLSRKKLDAIAECRRRILEYRFLMVFVETDDIKELRETFTRINSRGTPVSAADRAFAQAAKFSLRHLVHELRSGLAKGYSALPPEIALQVIALIFGAKDVGERAIQALVERLKSDVIVQRLFDRKWHSIKSSIEKAVDDLTSQLGVLNYGFLPSQNMVTTLALFFYYNDLQQPNPAQRRELQKWFWATAVCQRYTGAGFRQNILKDASFFKALGERRNGQFRLRLDELVSVTDLLRTDYSKRSGLADAYFCLLASYHPRYIKADGEIPRDAYSSRANRKDKHHVFPRELLKRNDFTRKEWNRLGNICFIAAEENQSFGNKAPVVYLEPHKRTKHFGKAMKSHLIPHSANSALWATRIKTGYKAFLKERTGMIAKAFEGTAGTKLFRKD